MDYHRHKAIEAKSKTRGWTKCVAPIGARHDDTAHGAMVITDVCRCGARRETEMNGRAWNQGEWIEEPMAAIA